VRVTTLQTDHPARFLRVCPRGCSAHCSLRPFLRARIRSTPGGLSFRSPAASSISCCLSNPILHSVCFRGPHDRRQKKSDRPPARRQSRRGLHFVPRKAARERPYEQQSPQVSPNRRTGSPDQVRAKCGLTANLYSSSTSVVYGSFCDWGRRFVRRNVGEVEARAHLPRLEQRGPISGIAFRQAKGLSCPRNLSAVSPARRIAESEGFRTGFRRKPDSIPMIADSR
jgi:hypothetical protein